MPDLWLIVGLVIGALAGAVAGWLLCERRARVSSSTMQTDLALAQERERDASEELTQLRPAIESLRRDLSGLQQERAALEAQLSSEKQCTTEQRDLVAATRQELESFRKQLSALQQDRSTLLAQLDAERRSLAEQKQQLAETQTRIREAFAELSASALEKNTQQFMQLAEEKFKTLQTAAAGTLDQKKAEMQQLITPMAQVLDQYKQKLDQIEKARTDAYTSISKELAGVAATQQNLSKETTQLVQALRRPQGRGRWGELTLKRLFEMAGMAERVTFIEQVSINTEDGRKRPDCIVHLPEERQVIVDSKCVIDAFLDASNCTDDVSRLACLARHAQQVRSRVQELSMKAYWESFERATDYVVLFLPGEAFLYAAVDQDPTLIEDALAHRVIIASPTTLLGLLRVIEHAWRQKQIEANATEIRDLGGQLYDRVSKMAEHFQKLGESIGKVGEQYNRTVGSLEKNVLPAARKMSQLGIAQKGEPIAELDDVPTHVRELSHKSWKTLPDAAAPVTQHEVP